MVTMLVNKMAKEIPPEPLTDTERLLLVEFAMWHDTPELLMGDLASPLKRRIEEISKVNNPIEAIENEIAPWLTNLKDIIKSKPECYVIFKLADLMDAIIFIFQEGVGEHAKSVRKNLESIFKKKVAEGKKVKPEYNWKVAETILHDLLHAKTNQLEFEYE
jgi:5'-deoxynucleotidase